MSMSCSLCKSSVRVAMSAQLFFNYLRIGLNFLLCLILLPFLCLIEIYHSIFTGRNRSFEGKTVLITGAGNGLGRELATQLARKKCTVLCVDMKKFDVNETVKAIESEKKGKAKFYVCDITDLEAVKQLRDSVLTEYGEIDLLINNAAFLYLMPISKGSDEHLRRSVDVNILGNCWMTRAFLPSMKKARSGQILFINSAAGITTDGGMCTYNFAKAALLSLAWSLREELDSNPEWKDIKVSSALPLFIATHPLYKNLYKSNFDTLSVEYTAACVLEGARRGFTEFSIPGGQLGSRLTFLFLKVLPRSFIKLLRPSVGVEIGQIMDTTILDKLTSPDYSIRDPASLTADLGSVKFSSGEIKRISMN